MPTVRTVIGVEATCVGYAVDSMQGYKLADELRQRGLVNPDWRIYWCGSTTTVKGLKNEHRSVSIHCWTGELMKKIACRKQFP